MSFLKNIFTKKDTSIKSYSDFWSWFQENERVFFNVVRSGESLQRDFFDKLIPKLGELNDGFFFLVGMVDENTAELVLTPDGVVKNIVFVEELVRSAPTISNWKFTALKPAIDIESVSIKMDGYEFNGNNLSFYAIDHKDYPDEVDIVIVHNDYNDEGKSIIINGTFIFLDNYLGELKSVTTIDNAIVISKAQVENELIPIAKLKDYLIWQESEFIEKYSGHRYDTESDSYSNLEAELDNGRPLVAVVNSTLLEWDSKASHPWILKVEIDYDGDNNNGMPDDRTYKRLNEFEEQIMLELKDIDGYLNIGRQTADNTREIYFACKDFRKPSKSLHELIKKYSNTLDVKYDIYKDKYWQSFERFRVIN